MLPNVPYFAVVYYGILRAGGVVVPMNVPQGARGRVLPGRPDATMFAWHGFADAAHAGSDRANADCLLVEPGDFEPCSNGRTPPSLSSATAATRL